MRGILVRKRMRRNFAFAMAVIPLLLLQIFMHSDAVLAAPPAGSLEAVSPEGGTQQARGSSLHISAKVSELRQRGDYAAAEKLVRDALKLNYSDEDKIHLLNDLGGVCLQSGKTKEAEEAYRQGVTLLEKAAPDSEGLATILDNLSVTCAENHNLKDAELFSRRSIDIYKKSNASAVDVIKSLNNLAQLQLNQNKLPEAEATFKDALEKAGGAKNVPVGLVATITDNLGAVYYQMGDLSRSEEQNLKALKDFESGLGKEHPETIKCASNLANVYAREGKWTESALLYTRCIDDWKQKFGANAPEIAGWQSSYRIVLSRMGEQQKEDKRPDTVSTFEGMKLLTEGKNTEAKASFEKAIQLNPKASGAYAGLAAVCQANGDNKGCIKEMTEALKYNPCADYYFIRGKIYCADHDHEHAIADLSQCIKMDEKHKYPAAKYYLGGEMLESGKTEEALLYLDQYVDSNAKDGNGYALRAVAHKKLGHDALSVSDLEKAKSLGFHP